MELGVRDGRDLKGWDGAVGLRLSLGFRTDRMREMLGGRYVKAKLSLAA